MGILKGLGKLNSLIEQNEQKSGDREKAKWLKMSAGQTVTLQFLQEIDDESPEFNAKAGTLLVATEHSNPNDFKKKALCTKDSEGQCYGCEMAKKHPKKGWNARGRLYANVLVDDGKESPYVAVLSQGISDKSITPSLVSFANDSGSITNIAFKVRRSGVGTATGYSIMPKIGSSGASLDGLELFDLEKSCTWPVAYAEQKEYYGAYRDESEEAMPVTEEDVAVEW